MYARLGARFASEVKDKLTIKIVSLAAEKSILLLQTSIH